MYPFLQFFRRERTEYAQFIASVAEANHRVILSRLVKRNGKSDRVAVLPILITVQNGVRVVHFFAVDPHSNAEAVRPESKIVGGDITRAADVGGIAVITLSVAHDADALRRHVGIDDILHILVEEKACLQIGQINIVADMGAGVFLGSIQCRLFRHTVAGRGIHIIRKQILRHCGIPIFAAGHVQRVGNDGGRVAQINL